MASNTGIEWTDATWNPMAGCTPVSPGCKNCYAMKIAGRLEAMGQPKYKGTTRKTKSGVVQWSGRINFDSNDIVAPSRWRKPRRIFVNSMSDLFHEAIPFEFIDRVFAVMNATASTLPASPRSKRWHTYQILTKRTERMADYLNSRSLRNFPLIGTHPVFNACRGIYELFSIGKSSTTVDDSVARGHLHERTIAIATKVCLRGNLPSQRAVHSRFCGRCKHRLGLGTDTREENHRLIQTIHS